MVQIVLIRPGSTDYDAQRRIQGNLDVPLNSAGTDEVARMVEELRAANLAIDVVYAPECQPALQTAKIIADALGVKFRVLEQMENVNLGLWQGMLIDEARVKQPKVYRQWQEQPEHVCPPEGEMLGEADQRVHAAMTRILKRHKEGTIAIVVSEPLATLVRRFVDHGELGDLWKAIAQRHGCWQVLETKPEAVTS
jgi:broad specificity phosphatase PhoE